MDWLPNSYEDLVPLLDRELARLEMAPLCLTTGQILEVLSGDAPAGAAAGACRQFARTGQVPVGLPDWTKLQVSCRLRAARSFCHDCAHHPYDGRAAATLLESLLTDYWDDAGRWNWIQEDVLGGDDFSGNEIRLPE